MIHGPHTHSGGPLVHHGPLAGANREFTGAVPSGQFQRENLTARGPIGGGSCGEPHRRLSWATEAWDSTGGML
jgi:hypothetical protein